MNLKRYILLLCVMLFSVRLVAQEVTFQSALSLFEKGDYNGAAAAFSRLLQKNNRDAKLNYYYGAALVESNQEVSEAVKRLKFAQLNRGGADVAFYQGRAAQLNYEFEQAIDHFTRYLKSGKDRTLLARANSYLEQSRVSVGLSSKFFDVRVMSRHMASRASLLDHYFPGKDVGSVLPNSAFFETGVDPQGLLYKTERGDAVYYARPNESGKNDLYRMQKLIGGWGDPQALEGLNSSGDDQMPFLMVDGMTIYFSSNREGGMGGLDIYRATYDPDSRSFSEPVNLGVPFNSPFDDFLFVADEFKNVAWFASNRHAPVDSVEVFQILWDGSVIRNLAMDAGAIRRAASLEPDSGLDHHPTNDKRPFTADKRIAKPAELFRFIINDTLTYTDWSHFRCDSAMSAYKRGYDLERHKDSLNVKMTQFRRLFSSTNDEGERNRAVNQILKLEHEVYGIDDQVERHFIKSRLLEINFLKENRGAQVTPVAVAGGADQEDASPLAKILVPSKFAYYSDEEFERQLNEWNLMYARLFDGVDGQELHRADSLYVWGNILTLESSRLNEQILKAGASLRPGGLFQNNVGDDNAETLRKNSRLYKATALELYHQALDTKYRLFTDKIDEMRLNEAGLDLDDVMDKQLQAKAYYSKANELSPVLDGSDFELYERAGTLKRQAVFLQTEALFLYLNHLDGSARLKPVDKRKDASQSVVVPNKVQDAPVAPASAVESAPKPVSNASDNKPEYRIQLGLFKNQPNPVALSQLPAIRKTVLENGQGTRYFSGQFATYDEAAKYVTVARELGFNGAFVVAFLKGEQISVAKAKELE